MSAYTGLKQKTVLIDSRQRTNASDLTSRTDAFEVINKLPLDNQFDKISLSECEIPKSWYMLDSATTFSLYETVGTQTTTVSITGGKNYTAAELATELASALTTASATGSNSFTYTCTFSSATGKFTYGHGGTGEFTLQLASSPLLAKYMGVYADDSSNVSASQSFVSPNIVNLQRYNILFIKSSLVENAGNDIIARVYPGDVAALDTLHYTSPDPALMSVGLAQHMSNQSGFCLQDENNAAVDLNGVDWRMTLIAFKDSDKPTF